MDTQNLGHLDRWVNDPTHGWWNPSVEMRGSTWGSQGYLLNPTLIRISAVKRITFLVTGYQTITQWENGNSLVYIETTLRKFWMGHTDLGMSDGVGTIWLGDQSTIRTYARQHPVEFTVSVDEVIEAIYVGSATISGGNYLNNTRGIKDLALHFT